MTHEPNQDEFSELLSAYLDGELTADEQALVEGRLAENTEFRQLHDELRAVRATLESLPRFSLKEDLASAVLRRAERAMLSTPSVSQNGSTPAVQAAVSLPEREPPAEWLPRAVRSMRWTIVAVAVAVLIMIFNPPAKQDVREVARHTPPSEAVVEGTVARDADAKMSAAPASKSLDSVVQDDRRMDRKNADLGVTEKQFKNSQADQDSVEPARDGLRRGASAAGGAAVADQMKKQAGSLGDTASSKRIEQMPAGGKAVAPAAPPAANSLAGNGPTEREKSADVDRSTMSLRERRASIAKSGAAGNRQLNLQGAPFAWSGVPGQAAGQAVLVVQVDIPADARLSGEFEQLLADQQIALVNGPAAAAVDGALDETKKFSDAKDAQPAKTAEEFAAKPGDNAEAPAAVQGVRGELAQVNPGALDAFLVEASAEQVNATIADLQSRHRVLFSLSTEPLTVNSENGGLPQNANGVVSATPAQEPAALTAEGAAAPAPLATAKPRSAKAELGEEQDEAAKDAEVAGEVQQSAQARSAGRGVAPDVELKLGAGGGAGDATAAAPGHATAARLQMNAEQLQRLTIPGAAAKEGATAFGGLVGEGNAKGKAAAPQIAPGLADKLAESKVAAPAESLPSDKPLPAALSESPAVPGAAPALGKIEAAQKADGTVARPAVRVLFLLRQVPAAALSR